MKTKRVKMRRKEHVERKIEREKRRERGRERERAKEMGESVKGCSRKGGAHCETNDASNISGISSATL